MEGGDEPGKPGFGRRRTIDDAPWSDYGGGQLQRARSVAHACRWVVASGYGSPEALGRRGAWTCEGEG